LVVPNKDYAIGDVLGSIAQVAISVIGTVATFGGAAPTTFAAFFSCLNMIRSGITSAININDVLKEQGAITIPPGQSKLVFERGMANPFKYLNSSQWGALCGGSDMTLAITNHTNTRQAVFNTNSDWSWVVNTNMVVRQKYGAGLSVQDPDAGRYPFSQGAQLIPGMSLKVGETLAAQNQESFLVLQEDSNLVLYYNSKPKVGGAIWVAPDTYQKGANKLEMKTDGVYLKKADGTVLWEQKYANSARFIVQDDHNLVLYNSGNQAPWASNTMNKT